MGPAHQGQVGQIGRATMQPMAQMMASHQASGRSQPGNTATVTNGQSGALGGLDDPGGPPTSSGWVGAPPRTGSSATAARSRSANGSVSV
jgi:hypothetical protein